MRSVRTAAALLLIFLLLCSCGVRDPEPTPSPSPTPAVSEEPVPHVTPEPTPEPTPVPSDQRDWISLEEFLEELVLHSPGHLTQEELLGALEDSGLQEDLHPYKPLQRQSALYLITLAYDLGDCSLPDRLLPFSDLEQVNPLCTDAVRHYYRLGFDLDLMAYDADGDGMARIAPAEILSKQASADWLSSFYSVPFGGTLDAEALIAYFEEVALHTEYDDNGQPASVPLCRWGEPIRVFLTGSYTDGDVALLQAVMDRMNEVDGFPGIALTEEELSANLSITFLSREEMNEQTAHLGGGVDGFANYHWYTDTCEIYSGRILYCSDLDELHRPGVLCEELIQIMGLSNDSTWYEDSIYYQYYSCVRWPSETDWKLFELLYDPALSSGMEAQQVYDTLTAN